LAESIDVFTLETVVASGRSAHLPISVLRGKLARLRGLKIKGRKLVIALADEQYDSW
jgi:hypothetical protein